MDIFKEIEKLNLPDDSYIVVGSGILDALGIRKTRDIDLVVSKNIYDKLEADNWGHGMWSDQEVLDNGLFEIATDWYGKGADELLQNAQYINEIPFLNLDDVYRWKKKFGRSKDLVDLKLINQYRLSGNK